MAEVYGTSWLEDGRDKIKALLDALVTTMASGYTPKLSYAYERHNEARLLLNAATVAAAGETQEITAGVSNTTEAVQYVMPFTVRVHTDYVGGVRDGQKSARLINSVVNKLKKNISLGDSYYISSVSDISPDVEFGDSQTYGAECVVTVRRGIVHTQE